MHNVKCTHKLKITTRYIHKAHYKPKKQMDLKQKKAYRMVLIELNKKECKLLYFYFILYVFSVKMFQKYFNYSIVQSLLTKILIQY